MRQIAVFILALFLTVSITSAQDSQLPAVDPSNQQIIFWHPFSGAQNTAMSRLIEEFNASNEYGISVRGVLRGSADSLRDQMQAAINANDLPELVTGFQNDAMSYALQEAVVDLNPYYDDPAWGFSDDEKADLNQAILNANVFDEPPFAGARLAWSNHASANVLAVNLTMLEALGFDTPPETFDDFKALACASREYSNAKGQPGRGYPIRLEASNFESMVASRGGQIFHAAAYDFTSQAALDTLQFYQDLYVEGCAYIPESRFGNTDDFARGLVPMAITSSAGIPFILEGFAASGIDDSWTVTTTPWTEGSQMLQVFVPSIIVLKSTPEAQLASWLFLKFLAGREQQAVWTQATAYFPARISAAELLGDYADSDPYFTAANQYLNDPQVKLYTAPRASSYGAVRDLIAQAMEDVTRNGANVSEVASRLEAEANQLHANS